MTLFSKGTAENLLETTPTADRRGFWSTSLLVATSAALGGIAVAIWNRRILAQMRQQPLPDE